MSDNNEYTKIRTAYPGGTDTPMMKSNRAGAELGFRANRPPLLPTPSREASKPGQSR